MAIKQRRCKFCKRPLTENNLTEFCCTSCYQSDIQMNLMMLTEINNHSVSPTSAASSAGGGDRIQKKYGPIYLRVDYTDTQFAFKFKAPSTSTLNIFDGDGTMTEVAGQDDTEVTHTTSYAAPGTYYFYVDGDYLDLTYIKISGQSFVSGDITRWVELINLEDIQVALVPVTGNISGFGVLPLTNIAALSAQLTCDVSQLASLVNLTNFTLSRNKYVYGDISSLYNLTSTIVNIETNITFDNIVTWNSGHFHAYDCEWTSTMVDNCLISLANGGTTGKVINVGGTNAARTSASDAAFAYLDANNTLTVNPPIE